MSIHLRVREMRKNPREVKIPPYVRPIPESIMFTANPDRDSPVGYALVPSKRAVRIYIIEKILRHHKEINKIQKTKGSYIVLKEGETLSEECTEALLNINCLIATLDETKEDEE